jgi:fermentation-respiration switch protein FrsA (DUF1100 family)
LTSGESRDQASGARLWRPLAALGLVLGGLILSLPFLTNALLYFPLRALEQTPRDAGLAFAELEIPTEDGERLHGWWIPCEGGRASLLLFHGNAGNISHRLLHARLLVDAGLSVLLFDYRGYGRSTGRADEAGTYRDARAARAALLRQEGVDAKHLLYLGESLGGAVALALALEAPPRGLVLQSAFTSVRDMARLHYPFVPGGLVPDAYPSSRRIGELRAPLLVLHGDRDDIVPLAHGRALYDAAPEPKRLHVFPGLGHNDLVPAAGRAYAEAIAAWERSLGEERVSD